MADSLHFALSTFRESILTAVARLEFSLRDAQGPSAPTQSTTEPKKDTDAQTVGRIESLESTVLELQSQITALLKSAEETKELLKIPAPPSTTRNILIATPALSAAVASVSASPPPMTLNQASEEDDVTMSVEDDSDEDGPELKQVLIRGKQYFMDSENSVYVETEEGYEEIGTYNPVTDAIEGIDSDDESEEEEEVVEAEVEEEEQEEEEEAVEVEEFIFKGKTYQRDSDQNVYEDGEPIGTWNGKKIVPLA